MSAPPPPPNGPSDQPPYGSGGDPQQPWPGQGQPQQPGSGGFGPPQGGGYGYPPPPPPPPGYGQQQPGYQDQPPQGYGQQPQQPGYGYPSQGFEQGGYGNVPPGGPYPPQPSGGGNGPKIIAAVVAAVVVIGGGIGAAIALSGGGNDKKASTTTSASASHHGGALPSSLPTDLSTSGLPTSFPTDLDTSYSFSMPPMPTFTFPTDLFATPTYLKFVYEPPGTCFNTPTLDSSITQVQKVSCNSPHNAESIAKITLSGSFDSDTALQTKALDLCQPKAKARWQKQGTYDTAYPYVLYPKLATYEGGEHRVTCAIAKSNTKDGPKFTKPLK